MSIVKMPLTGLELPYPGGSGNHSVRHAGGSHYLSDEAKAYRVLVALACRHVRPVVGPLCLDWLIAPPDKRARDIDNLFKVVCDALTHAGFWPDDSNKVITQGAWQWAAPVPGGAIFLTVYEAT